MSKLHKSLTAVGRGFALNDEISWRKNEIVQQRILSVPKNGRIKVLKLTGLCLLGFFMVGNLILGVQALKSIEKINSVVVSKLNSSIEHMGEKSNILSARLRSLEKEHATIILKNNQEWNARLNQYQKNSEAKLKVVRLNFNKLRLGMEKLKSANIQLNVKVLELNKKIEQSRAELVQ